ncbi:hypothetical protein EDC27_1000 [Desulfosoma caldarium]|uniref:Uncharacterized protein n=1 Tax=Desulfosoma caldarium TaxID=610254 RepID=A0A3N1VLH0_9BACT|nr:hypothetical protein EDC27_1000 [Desulfosoma caldarium]
MLASTRGRKIPTGLLTVQELRKAPQYFAPYAASAGTVHRGRARGLLASQMVPQGVEKISLDKGEAGAVAGSHKLPERSGACCLKGNPVKVGSGPAAVNGDGACDETTDAAKALGRCKRSDDP